MGADLAEAHDRGPVTADGFLARRALLRRVLAESLGPGEVLLVDDAGRRFASCGDRVTWWSSSSSGQVVVIAVADAPVGVDVEVVAAVPEAAAVARQLFRPDEADAVTTVDEPLRTRRLLTTWVAKEAVVKATGEGLSRDLTSFHVPDGKHWRPVSWYGIRGPSLLVAAPLASPPGCVVAVAVTS